MGHMDSVPRPSDELVPSGVTHQSIWRRHGVEQLINVSLASCKMGIFLFDDGDRDGQSPSTLLVFVSRVAQGQGTFRVGKMLQ